MPYKCINSQVDEIAFYVVLGASVASICVSEGKDSLSFLRYWGSEAMGFISK